MSVTAILRQLRFLSRLHGRYFEPAQSPAQSTEGLVGKWSEDEALKMTLGVPNWARGNLIREPTFA
jgi:hypothetical protein